MQSPLSSLLTSPVLSVAESIGNPERDLSTGSLFHVGNAYAPFKTHTHKVRYPSKPREGASAIISRRNAPGSGIARLWLRARTLCSATSTEKRRMDSDTIQLSVKPGDLEKAYEKISALLTDDFCPFSDFKVLNPDMKDARELVGSGGQITLFVHHLTDPCRVWPFLMVIGAHLCDADVDADGIPQGDSPIPGDGHLKFFSCRSEELANWYGIIPLLQAEGRRTQLRDG